MTSFRTGYLSIFCVTGLTVGTWVYAQQPADGTPAPKVTVVPADAPAAPKTPTPDELKKAREAGYKAEVHSGVTKFCREETPIGSHFATKNCLSQGQLELVLEREQAARDQLTNHTCTGCSGK